MRDMNTEYDVYLSNGKEDEEKDHYPTKKLLTVENECKKANAIFESELDYYEVIHKNFEKKPDKLTIIKVISY